MSTLDILHAIGLSSTDAGHGRRTVRDAAGEPLFTGTAHSVHHWLYRTGRRAVDAYCDDPHCPDRVVSA